MRRSVRVPALLLLLFMSVSSFGAGAEKMGFDQPPVAPLPANHTMTSYQFPQGEQEKPDPELEKKMEKARRKDRYAGLKRDSEKLLELATELKQQVDRSGENVLSMDVVRKCEEIEKLAKSVRTKMRGE